jgi:hypothetical protein
VATEYKITVQAQRDDGRNGGELTIARLRQFLEEYDRATGCRVAELADALHPKVRVRFGGGIRSITVTVPG